MAVQELVIDEQILNVVVRYRNQQPWLLSGIYASPNAVNRKALWEYLIEMGRVVKLPWMLVGDFNQIMFESEKKGGRPANQNQIEQLNEVVNRCELYDLGFTSPKFTWSNLRQGKENVQERLDRAICNYRWMRLFPNSHIWHLPRSRSDHNPILVGDRESQRQRRHVDNFRVQAAWFKHPGFEAVLTKCWTTHEQSDMLTTLNALREALQSWNRYTFGNIFDWKSRCLTRISGIQRSLEH